MNRSLTSAGLFLAVVTTLGTSESAIAGDRVPFHGRLDGVVTRTPLLPTPIVKVDIAATGNATHLGTYRATAPHLVDTSVTPRTATGRYVFVAANGDKLVATFTGVSVPTATPGVLSIIENAVIDPLNSTGRFAGSNGSFKAERLFNTTTGLTKGTFAGTISIGK
jgi:hypothetical protein